MFCAVALLGGFLLLGFTETRYFDPRFTMPFMPLLALISASVFRENKRHRRVQLVALVIIFCLVLGQFASLTFATPLLSVLSSPANSQTMMAVYPPSREDWKISEIVRSIGIDATAHRLGRPVVAIPVFGPYFDDSLFLYYAFVNGVNLTIDTSGYLSAPAAINGACASDYVVLLTNSSQSGFIGGAIGQNVGVAIDWVRLHISSYVSVGNYTLPDGSVAHLYRRLVIMDCNQG